MATNIKITALNDISANMTYNDLVAVVDMNGTPETKKANVQVFGNLILSSAGGSYFAKAAEATNAETVSNAAQPAITSVGTLTALTVTGNVGAGNVSGTGGVFTYISGDGANLTNLPSGSNSAAIANGTSNVNIPALNGNINTSVAGNANILIVTGTGANVTGTFNATGNAVVGNISATNLGNVSAVNLDGNVLNILHGDGSWSADATSYGDSNVVTLMGAFGSNTITTTGVISGDGSGLSAIAGANVSGAVALATDATSANAVAGANVSGEVTFAATANAVAGANVSGAVALATDATSANAVAGANVSGTVALATSATSANSVAGANVSGEVTFAATANAVAYANVSGTPTLGNIATINIDGDAANVLYGNGAFAAAPAGATYGDSNVITLMGAFGSSPIFTSGLVTGDGGGLGNIVGANVSGAVPLATFATTANAVALANVTGSGNIASINIDGSAGNVLYGNGVFAAASSPALTGDGYQLANLTGANVSGTVALATTAVLAQEVINSAQPNIGSVGTLSTLLVSGNVTGQSYVSATTALQTTPVITSALPAAATAGAGARSMVTDADAGSVFGAALTGAGSLTLPVFSDGTIWRVG
jgi:hypothetical protein